MPNVPVAQLDLFGGETPVKSRSTLSPEEKRLASGRVGNWSLCDDGTWAYDGPTQSRVVHLLDEHNSYGHGLIGQASHSLPALLARDFGVEKRLAPYLRNVTVQWALDTGATCARCAEPTGWCTVTVRLLVISGPGDASWDLCVPCTPQWAARPFVRPQFAAKRKAENCGVSHGEPTQVDSTRWAKAVQCGITNFTPSPGLAADVAAGDDPAAKQRVAEAAKMLHLTAAQLRTLVHAAKAAA